MTNLDTLLSEARARGKEPKLVEGLEKLIADLSLLTPYDAVGMLQLRWGIRSEDGRPWEEPAGPSWMEINGHRWACDGAIVFREDAPRPLWRELGRDFGEYRDKAPRIQEWLGQTHPTEWADLVSFSPRFAPLLRECPAVSHGPLRGACWRDREIIALVMPLRRGCRGVDPSGLPVEAEPSVLVEAREEWTDDDARNLGRLTRKARRDQVDPLAAHISGKDRKELSTLRQKQKRCAS